MEGLHYNYTYITHYPILLFDMWRQESRKWKKQTGKLAMQRFAAVVKGWLGLPAVIKAAGRNY
jgi:hypothetical protein